MINLGELINDIEIQKEIISTLPTNTKKNKALYVEKLEEIKDKYTNLQKEVINSIENEYIKELNKYTMDESLELKLMQITEIEKIRNAIDKIKNAYEKMELDKSIYNLKRFYKKNLKTINMDIKNCIELFKKIKIDLTADDFNFTPYTKQYMKLFLSELKNEKFDTEKMQKEFEKIYWKSPNLIVHIQLNIRYLFFKKEVYLERFYLEQDLVVRKKIKINSEAITERYNYLKRTYMEENKKQSKYILDKFLNGYWSFKDYEEKSINKSYAKFISLEKLKENREEINNNLIKLLHNLYEYKNYLRFKYLYDEIRHVYLEEKSKSKDTYKSIRKKIVNKGRKLTIIGRFIKISQKEREKILKEMEELYEQLDNLRIKEKIHEILNDKSTLKEIGNLLISFYKHLFICIIKNNKDITEQEIKVQIEEFEESVKYPYNTISQSIIMKEDKDIPLMIKDRYNLFDIKIAKEEINENNIDNLILDLEKIENYYYIKEAGLELENIELLYKMKNIISENE